MLDEPIRWSELRRNWWKLAIVAAFGIGLTVVLVMTHDAEPRSVKLSANEITIEVDGSEVIAGKGASRENARAVGRALHEQNWFDTTKRASAWVEHVDRWTIALAVVAVNRAVVTRLRLLAEPLSAVLQGPVDLVLSDNVATPLYKAPWEKRLRRYTAGKVETWASPADDERNRKVSAALAEHGWEGELLLEKEAARYLASVVFNPDESQEAETGWRAIAELIAGVLDSPVAIELTDANLVPHRIIEQPRKP